MFKTKLPITFFSQFTWKTTAGLYKNSWSTKNSGEQIHSDTVLYSIEIHRDMFKSPYLPFGGKRKSGPSIVAIINEQSENVENYEPEPQSQTDL